ncbi:MAG: hypothetical protein R2875_13795 [Desulfobacterales bacterium]
MDIPQSGSGYIRDIGYSSSRMGFDWQTCAVLTSIDHQSADIAQGVNVGRPLQRPGSRRPGTDVWFCI